MKYLRGYILTVCIAALSTTANATVTFTGATANQLSKLASWLSLQTGTTVTIDATGKVSIGGGGNASATRLRQMINDTTVDAKLNIVVDVPTISLGAWNPADPTKPQGPTNGIQTIDFADFENIGNLLGSFGFSAGSKLMHEITEIYQGLKNKAKGWTYHEAHTEGVKAEKESMAAFKTSWVGPRYTNTGGFWDMKIKRPDGTFVIARTKAYVLKEKVDWFKEKVPCKSTGGLIAIADPDPQVHILNYAFDLNHSFGPVVDAVDSMPTGVAYDAFGNLYVCENFVDPTFADEIRIFDPNGIEISRFIDQENLVDPEGIDIDRTTGDIYVATEGKVIRYDSSFNLVGTYSDSANTSFTPTDVAISDVLKTDDLPFSPIVEFFVTDLTSDQVYRFNISQDLNQGTFQEAFGSSELIDPEGLDIGDWGAVWVASTGNNRIFRYQQTGELIPGPIDSYFVEDITFQFMDVVMLDNDGIYAVDGTTGGGRLQLYDFDGNIVKTYGDGVLQCPTSVDVMFTFDEGNLVIPDQLHIVGPIPNQVPVGMEFFIQATTEADFVGYPLQEVTFTNFLGNVVFASGNVSPDGTQATIRTDASGLAEMTCVADEVGPTLIGVTVTGTELSAFSFLFTTP